tara:strand:- start:14302 stop:14724 length:423 start_codon:yes stop_codon:yes gene_type:complete
MTPQELKKLQTETRQLRSKIGQIEADKREIARQLKAAKEKVSSIQSELTAKDREIAQATKRLTEIEKTISGKTESQVVVSEHAMLRYIERVLGIDLEELQQKILPPGNADAISSLGDGTYPIGEHRIKVKSGTIVTVLPK